MPRISQGPADALELGAWNAICAMCGRKNKSSRMKKNWKNNYVCDEHWEPRPAQDFVKTVAEEQPPEWTQPPPPDLFVP